MTESNMRHVVYVAEVADRPGTVHAIAAVFAHRGLSMRALIADASRQPARILVPFIGSERQCTMVEQVIARLHHVRDLRVLPADAPELRASAVCSLATPPPDLPGIDIHAAGDRWVLSGSYGDIERAIEQLRRDDTLLDVFHTVAVL
ncbi:hypothetical protein [Solimonas marina]|uniref:ACT domain-containing protein n=1 Tax=Solimonas marina TaxID=2714601 RepID=A0A969W9G5_9GAMM|nr:hypothetical protein [Solimonas marina]NKF23102.1 hypothetical protein [Solimonas marina]